MSACERLIQIDTPEELENISIESWVSTEDRPWEIRITRSQAYYQQDSAKGELDALVIISDDAGLSDTLQAIGAGRYRSKVSRPAVPGRTYQLSVRLDGQEYTASDYCRFQYPIDTLAAYYLKENNGFIQKGWYVFEQAQEWEAPGDYYEWFIYRNDTLIQDFGIITDEDQFRDNSYFNLNIDRNDPLKGIDQGILPRPFPLRFEPGDSVEVIQTCINRGYYDFLQEVQRQLSNTGGPFSSPPANPNSNISNGAYGYFSVVNTVRAKAVVPKK